MERSAAISNVQHGFVRGKCCQTQLLTVTEDWTKWMEENKPFHCMYLNYRTTFDSVPHVRLLRKVKDCGITGQVQIWIKSFLQGRRQSKSRTRRFRMEKRDIWDSVRLFSLTIFKCV